MSVLIRGMEMPECCGYCPFEYKNYCVAKPSLAVESADRHPRCPLVPVPPHFDLIDHNALKIAVMDSDAETRIDFLKHAMDCINKAPVVIPSDMPLFEPEEGDT